jgi:aromatic-L-amino-acid decarboxylase
VTGLGDMDAAEFRAAAHATVDRMADYLESVASRPVLPAIEPGTLRGLFAEAAPEAPESLEAILADYDRLIEPNATHWQHPGFMAYFASSAAGAGIIGEMLVAALNQNPMLWRTSPIGTELETVVVDWLRGGLGLTDRDDLPALRVYASAEAHSSVEKACMTLGLGRAALVRIPVNERFELIPQALDAAIAEDLAAGRVPVAIVATLGTTSSTSVDPVAAIADIAERDGIWLHVDAAYAGAVALLPERRSHFEGWERADSIVVNPHKWLFTPVDASLLLTRRLDRLAAAFSLHPEYLRTLDRTTPVRDFTDFTPQLGRRMRALKLWIELRWFGLEGLRRRIRHHIELAQELADAVDADPQWERLAPAPFSTVCLRWRPARLDEAALDRTNAAIMDAVNRSGEVFLSHTRLDGRFTIRVAIGNLRTERRHVGRAWQLLREAARTVEAGADLP